VIIPTYNEKENITAIINAVLNLGDDFNVLVEIVWDWVVWEF
jgi:glycosyltransferase involved in cell wall biosynthesis